MGLVADKPRGLLMAQSGHPDRVGECLLLTLSGHGRLGLAVMHNTPCCALRCFCGNGTGALYFGSGFLMGAQHGSTP